MHFEQGGATNPNQIEGPPSQPQTQPDRLVFESYALEECMIGDGAFRLEMSLGLPAHHNPMLHKKTRAVTATALIPGPSSSTGTRLSLPPIDDGAEQASAVATGGAAGGGGTVGSHYRPR